MLLQAHRGARLHYPENTLPAYYGAAKEGYEIVELDTKFTKDGKCVLLHDRTVNRTGRKDDGSLFEEKTDIGTLTLAEAKQIDFGLAFAEEFRGTRIPELKDVLKFVSDTGLSVKFDNVIESEPEDHLHTFFEEIREANLGGKIGITAKTVGFVRTISSNLPDAVIHYDGPTSPDLYPVLAEAAKGHELFIWLPSEPKSWLPYPPATEADLALARKYGKACLWTAHSPESLAHILSLRPDAAEFDGTVTAADVPPEYRTES